MADVRSSTQQLDTIRSVLDSRGFDSSHVQPYTRLHLNASGKQTLSSLLTRFEHHRFPFLFEGDIVLTTPSLESLRLTSEPRYPYRAMLSARRSNELDQHTLLYDSLEDRRYRSLAIKQPIVHHVARIFHERFDRAEPSPDASQHRSASDRLPHLDQTMVSQRFNKISPFATNHGNNPHLHREALT